MVYNTLPPLRVFSLRIFAVENLTAKIRKVFRKVCKEKILLKNFYVFTKKKQNFS